MTTWRQWLLHIIYSINHSLELKWITTSRKEFFLGQESDVFETMDLTKGPKDIILILTFSLNLPL